MLSAKMKIPDEDTGRGLAPGKYFVGQFRKILSEWYAVAPHSFFAFHETTLTPKKSILAPPLCLQVGDGRNDRQVVEALTGSEEI